MYKRILSDNHAYLETCTLSVIVQRFQIHPTCSRVHPRRSALFVLTAGLSQTDNATEGCEV